VADRSRRVHFRRKLAAMVLVGLGHGESKARRISPNTKTDRMVMLLNLNNIFLLLAGKSIAVAWHRLVMREQPGINQTPR
jgi:hypothetical protein